MYVLGTLHDGVTQCIVDSGGCFGVDSCASSFAGNSHAEEIVVKFGMIVPTLVPGGSCGRLIDAVPDE